MEWLNYHHLLYFWVVAREGSIASASEQLRVASPTISSQIKHLEERFGEKLFKRAGRGLALTDAGRTAYRYADDIFGLGQELVQTLKAPPGGRPSRFTIGVSDALPKIAVTALIAPALALEPRVEIIVRESKHERLLAELAVHEIDLVLSDTALAASSNVRAFNHTLAESGTSFVAPRTLARKLSKGFPQSLHGAPMLLPTPEANVRRGLDAWFLNEKLVPNVVAQFDDTALMKMVAAAGHGVCPIPTLVESEVTDQLRLSLVGRTAAVRERFFAISLEKRVTHPAVVAIRRAARERSSALESELKD